MWAGILKLPIGHLAKIGLLTHRGMLETDQGLERTILATLSRLMDLILSQTSATLATSNLSNPRLSLEVCAVALQWQTDKVSFPKSIRYFLAISWLYRASAVLAMSYTLIWIKFKLQPLGYQIWIRKWSNRKFAFSDTWTRLLPPPERLWLLGKQEFTKEHDEHAR